MKNLITYTKGTPFFSKEKWIVRLKITNVQTREVGYKEFTSKDKEQGKRIVNRKQKEYMENGLLAYKKQESITLNDYIIYWLENHRSKRVKDSTYHREVTTFRSHIQNDIGKKQMRTITTAQIQRLIDSKIDIIANRTIEKIISLLKRVFDNAIKEKRISANPCDDVDFNRSTNNMVEAKDIQIYTKEETEMMANIVEATYMKMKIYRDSPSYVLLLNTGLRVGELLALRWRNIDFKNKSLSVKNSSTTLKEGPNKGETIITAPKTKNSIRKIGLNKTAIDMLNKIKTKNELDGIKSEFVICTNNGKIQNYVNYRRSFERFCEKYGIEYKGIHSLRHTFASRLFAMNMDLLYISKLLGHEDPSITLKTYIHIIDGKQNESLRKIEKI